MPILRVPDQPPMRPSSWLSDIAGKHLIRRRRSPSPLPLPIPAASKTLNPNSSSPSHTRRPFCSDGLSDIRDRIVLLTEKASFASISPSGDIETRFPEISSLADALLAADDPPAPLLSSRSAASLLRRSPSAPLYLLSLLSSRPLLALEVFKWRRDHAADISPVPSEEYSKAITLASRSNKPDLAADLFSDARIVGLCATPLYNALMSGYMYNSLIKRSLAVFEDLKRDPDCAPTIATYNILLSIFGRSLLVDHMEAVLSALKQSELALNLCTYNTVIAAYVTAWKWDKMESTFRSLEESPFKPDIYTYLLMLRGYSHAGNLEKMEETYEVVREQVNDGIPQLIRVMICAYCKSSDPERIRKVEALAKHIPEDEYRAWLNVLMIRLYAQEGLMGAMEEFITEAMQRNTAVLTMGIMRSIVVSYFKCNAVDRLAWFVKQAEDAGWRICRTLYHTKMVMYGKQKRLQDMHGVLDELEANKFGRTKKTFVIMYKAYLELGRRHEVETIVGMMWKHGFGTPQETFSFLSSLNTVTGNTETN